MASSIRTMVSLHAQESVRDTNQRCRITVMRPSQK